MTNQKIANMDNPNFDIRFKEITTEMVEIAYEFVDFNEEIIDTIFIMGSIEDELIFFNFFYRINGVLLKASNVNRNGKITFDSSDSRLSSILTLGNNCMQQINSLFLNSERDVPTLIRIVYFPKTQKFECKLNYDLQYSNSEVISYADVLSKWFKENDTHS